MCAKYMVDLSIVICAKVQAKQALLFCSLQYIQYKVVLMSMTACRQGKVGM